MPPGFGLHTSCTRFTIFLDKFMESGPGIIAADEVHCLILTRMTVAQRTGFRSSVARSEMEICS